MNASGFLVSRPSVRKPTSAHTISKTKYDLLTVLSPIIVKYKIVTKYAFIQQAGAQLDLLRLRPPRGQRKYVPQLDGFVEIFYKKKWRKVCVDEWDERVASVVCGQLGFPSASRVRNLESYL